MQNATYVALSRQDALRRQMDVVAHNIANSNTTAFKGQRMLFTEFLERPGMHEQVSFVQDRAVVRDTANGGVASTGNLLDFAIHGNGYFTLDSASGRRYSRAGNFQLNEQRQITDTNGLPVLSDGGQPMVVPEGAKEIRLSGDGTLATETGPIGKFNVVVFKQEQLMTEVGSGLYVTDEEPQAAPTETKLAQGMLEQSNVKPIVEMTNMMEIMRQYQQTQKMLETEHERMRTVIQRLGRAV
jgi:flagellar basal-body rod protein FlgF